MLTFFTFCGIFVLAVAKPASNPDPEYGEYWQGDIELQDGKHPLVSEFNAIVDLDLLWTDNVLYYSIDPVYTAEQVDKIRFGAEDLMSNVNNCVQLIEVDWENPGVDNYCFITPFSGCSSYIGMIGGSQRISLVDSCVDRHGTVMHEFLHALGHYHEHMRGDRDDYVIIYWDNIQPGASGNFVKLEEGTQIDHLGTTYDYGSVLHYSETAFAIDSSQPTIETINPPGSEIGQRIEMSQLDSERVQILYSCLAIEDSSFKGMTKEQIFKPAKMIGK